MAQAPKAISRKRPNTQNHPVKTPLERRKWLWLPIETVVCILMLQMQSILLYPNINFLDFSQSRRNLLGLPSRSLNQ